MLYQQITQNKRKTWLVMTGFLFLVILIGLAIGKAFLGSSLFGMILALGVALVYMSYTLGNSLDLVMKMNHATEITQKTQAPELWNILEDMALVAKIPTPRLFIIDDPSPNAFATGNDPKHAAVAVTSGLLELLNREELEGVIAHEVSHIRNYDIRLQTTALALVSAISLLVIIARNSFYFGGGRREEKDKDSGPLEMILMVVAVLALILGPVVANLVQLALSRNREYLADASAVELTRNPLGLIGALEKLANQKPMQQADEASAALYIVNPFKKDFSSLFATHPPIEQRIERLRQM